MYLSKATFPFTCFLSLYFVVLSAYDDYASTSPTTSGPIEWILGGVQGSSRITLSTIRLATSAMASSPS